MTAVLHCCCSVFRCCLVFGAQEVRFSSLLGQSPMVVLTRCELLDPALSEEKSTNLVCCHFLISLETKVLRHLKYI